MKNSELVGKKFGRLYVAEKVQSVNYRARFRCVCDCGNEKIVLGQNLLNGHVQSCGCLHAETSSERIHKYNEKHGRESHGETKTRLYAIWEGMKTRCYKESHHSFHNYGGRGIVMCEEWKNSFLSFRDWAISNGYAESLSIDRIDVNGNYFPENCRWADTGTQAANKRPLARNTSGVTGVSYNKKSGKYVAYISKNYKLHFLGQFDNIEDAAKARKKAEKQLHEL